MTVEELRAIGAAMFGYGWQTKLARELGITGRTVRAWMSGQNPVPEWLEAALAGVSRRVVDVPEWLLGEPGDGGKAYIIHLASPRFLCRLAGDEELLSGISFCGGESQVGELVWLDLPQPEDAVRHWLEAAMDWAETLGEN